MSMSTNSASVHRERISLSQRRTRTILSPIYNLFDHISYYILNEVFDNGVNCKRILIFIYVSALVKLLFLLASSELRFHISNWIFFKLIGISYAVAWISLISQVSGLIGSNGIIPISKTMKFYKRLYERQEELDKLKKELAAIQREKKTTDERELAMKANMVEELPEKEKVEEDGKQDEQGDASQRFTKQHQTHPKEDLRHSLFKQRRNSIGNEEGDTRRTSSTLLSSLMNKLLGTIVKFHRDQFKYLAQFFTISWRWKQYLQLPTVFWWSTSDFMLNFVCVAGLTSAVFLLIGIGPVPLLVLCSYLLYLSIMHVSGEFLALQWDVLLLETGFHAFLASLFSFGFRIYFHFLPDATIEPSKISWFLLWWLAFRLMFSSGLVKLTSGDPNWRNLKAMNYHYFTQPIPNPLSFFMHHRSEQFHRIETLATLAVELLVPFLIFGPSFLQPLAFLLLVSLNLMISLTGNYGFFNLLYSILCIPFLDDKVLTGNLFSLMGFLRFKEEYAMPTFSWTSMLIEAPLLVVMLSLSLVPFVHAFSSIDIIPLPPILLQIYSSLSTFYLVNSYGLFAVMTTARIELIIEGSHNGNDWYPYEFKYKPGNVFRRPPFIPGHMPRLDWRLWFLPLQPSIPKWFLRFLEKLLEGNKSVLDLLAKPLHPQLRAKPPSRIRVLLYAYTFSSYQQWKERGKWWDRKLLGRYIPFDIARQISHVEQ